MVLVATKRPFKSLSAFKSWVYMSEISAIAGTFEALLCLKVNAADHKRVSKHSQHKKARFDHCSFS